MIVKVIEVKATCKSCTKPQLFFELGMPVKDDIIELLKANDFTINKKYFDIGLLQAESGSLIITAPIGSNKLSIRPKNNNTEQEVENLRHLLERV